MGKGEIEKSMPKVEVLHDELRKAAKESGLFMAVLVLTDILEERSFLLMNDEKGLCLAAHVFGVSPNASGLLVLPGVMYIRVSMTSEASPSCPETGKPTS